MYKPYIFRKVKVLSTRVWMIKQNLLNVGIFRQGKGKRYLTLEQCFNKMYIANNVWRDCHFVYGFIFVKCITYYSKNPADDCSAYYPVAKRCWTSKWNDPFIYDPISVMFVTYCSQMLIMLMCKSNMSKTIITYNYQL